VIVNAAIENANIIALLPNYIFKHLHYFRVKYPDFFPNYDISSFSLPKPTSTTYLNYLPENIGISLLERTQFSDSEMEEFFKQTKELIEYSMKQFYNSVDKPEGNVDNALLNFPIVQR
jgi:hypothetical protein